jgi:hypothetical protein
MNDKRQNSQLELAFEEGIGVKLRMTSAKGPNRLRGSAERKPG